MSDLPPPPGGGSTPPPPPPGGEFTPPPPPPPPPPPERWLRPRMRFMFILLPSCFPIVGGPVKVSVALHERPRTFPWPTTIHRR